MSPYSLPSDSSKNTISFPFVKMHGLGNDFVVLPENNLAGIDLLAAKNEALLQELTVFLCDRHFGIGADGLILAGSPSDPLQYASRFVYLNSDGTWAEMCGNGIRCFARFVYDHQIVCEKTFAVETLAGPITPSIQDNGLVTVNMGAPVLAPDKIPFKFVNALTPDQSVSPVLHDLKVNNQTIRIMPVSMGNPHCIIFQDDQDGRLDPAVFGPAIEAHDAFPAKTNVEFVEFIDRSHLKVTVWERGCGFTQACGTGACATAVSAVLQNKVEPSVKITLPGGTLNIEWSGDVSAPVYMTGPATYVFSGNVLLPESLILKK